MSDISIQYKGAEIANLSASGTKTLNTSGKYCEGDISVVYDRPTGSGGSVLQASKTVTKNGTYTADAGYNAITSIVVNVPEAETSDLETYDISKNGSNVEISFMSSYGDRYLYEADGTSNSLYSLSVAGSNFGDASQSDVASGKTFTSANGVKISGTKIDPVLQSSKTVTENGTYSADDGYNAVSSFVVNVPTGVDTSSDTVTADKMLENTTAHNASGQEIVGTIKTFPSTYYDASKTGGSQLTPGDQAGLSGLTSEQLVFSFIPDDNYYINNEINILTSEDELGLGSYIGSEITKKAAQAYTPGTTNQTISANQYLTGVQTIYGDANLTAENIAKDVKIFGVTGTHQGGVDTSSDTVTESTMLSGVTAHDANGNSITGNIEKISGFGLSNQTVEQYANFVRISGTPSNEGYMSKDKDVNCLISASLFGNAQKSAVLKGSTFTSSAGTAVEGTMLSLTTGTTNYSSMSKSGNNILVSGTIVAGGYYPASTVISTSIPASNFGNATASQVVSGSTFTSESGIAISGTLVVQKYYKGSSEPSNSLGNDGDLYLVVG